MFLRRFSWFSVVLFLTTPLHAKKPAAPTNLRAKAVGANAFQLKWKDNSNNETGWVIRVGLSKGRLQEFKRIPVADVTAHTFLTNDLPGRKVAVQVLAYKEKKNGEVQLSKPSSVAETTALSPAKFDEPAKLKAKAVGDGSIRLRWQDNATTEEGYQVMYRKEKGAWQEFALLDPDKRFNLLIGGLEPKTKYSFRVRAFKSGGVETTAFTRKSTARTKSFRRPQSLVARNVGEGGIGFRWKDKSEIEDGFEIEGGLAGGPFTVLGEVGANVKRTKPLGGFLFGKLYKFRVRAFRNGPDGRIYSRYSKVTNARPIPLAAPTDFVGTVTGETSVNLKWKGASKLATHYEIYMRRVGETAFSYLGEAPVDDPEADILALTPGVAYQFRVRAKVGTAVSDFTDKVLLVTDGVSITSNLHPFIFFDSPFDYEVEVTDPNALASLEVAGLPAGLGFSASTRTISGAATEDGLKMVRLTATFRNGTVVEEDLVLRIVRQPSAPMADAPFDPAEVGAGAQAEVPLAGHFSDPDSYVARRVTTPLGFFDVILYSLATPGTATNFLSYADGGRYQDSFFHRSPPGFVIQGGGFTHDGSDFGEVTTDPTIANEPGISNEEGTVAMAKKAGDPDSADAQFFANVGDNSSNLDNQNGGFTAFGRVAGDGMDVVEAINDLPTGDYTVDIDGQSRLLEDVPMNDTSAPAAMDPAKLVKILSVNPVDVLSYDAVSRDDGIATAAVVGGNVVIDGVATGSTIIDVTATDLDGQTTTATIDVTVP